MWVSLQIESIWEDCFCDFEIRAALADLPKDLSETYRRCVKRINTRHNKFALHILRWICAAITPFTVEQLCEAWAIYVNHGRLNRLLMPSKQDILRSCSILITLDSQDHVLLAPHSVLQFLVTRPEDHRIFRDSFSVESAKLELGELCVAHLTSEDYNLAVQHFNKGPTLHIEPMAVATLTNASPSLLRFAISKFRSTQITLPLTPESAQVPTHLPSFFHFARDQWAPLTSHLRPDSRYWDSFRTLALQPNLTWRMHPLVPLAQSASSHYSGLLGWAIANRHRPLIDILMHIDTFRMRDDMEQVLEASKRSLGEEHPDTLRSMNNLAISYSDLGRRNEAVELREQVLEASKRSLGEEHPDTLKFMNNLAISKEADVNAQGGQYRNALQAASSKGNEAIVRLLLDKGADDNTQGGSGPTSQLWSDQQGDSTAPTSQALISSRSIHFVGAPASDRQELESVASDHGDIASTSGSDSDHFPLRNAATYFLVKLFIADEELTDLYKEALQKLDEERFVRNNGRLLESYYFNLKGTVKTGLQGRCIRCLKSSTERMKISSKIYIKLTTVGAESTERGENVELELEREEDLRFTLNHYLDEPEAEHHVARAAIYGEESQEQGNIRDDDDDEPDSEISEDGVEDNSYLYTNLESAIAFLVAGQPFVEYKEDLHNFLRGPRQGETAPRTMTSSEFPIAGVQKGRHAYSSVCSRRLLRNLMEAVLPVCFGVFERLSPWKPRLRWNHIQLEWFCVSSSPTRSEDSEKT